MRARGSVKATLRAVWASYGRGLGRRTPRVQVHLLLHGRAIRVQAYTTTLQSLCVRATLYCTEPRIFASTQLPEAPAMQLVMSAVETCQHPPEVLPAADGAHGYHHEHGQEVQDEVRVHDHVGATCGRQAQPRSARRPV